MTSGVSLPGSIAVLAIGKCDVQMIRGDFDDALREIVPYPLYVGS